MEAVSATASILAIVEATLRVGSVLFDKYTAYKDAQREIFELYVRYRGAWFQVRDEIQILECLVNVLEEPLLLHFLDQLNILEAKLQASISKLDRSIESSGKVAKKSYSIHLKAPLKKTIGELEEWAKRFRPSWFSTARTLRENLLKYVPTEQVAYSQAARKLIALQESLQRNQEHAPNDSIFLPQLNFNNKRHLPGSSATAANSPDNEFDLIIDKVEGCGPASPFALDVKDVQTMAYRLATVDDPLTWGLIRCHGVLKVQEHLGSTSRYFFIFQSHPGLSEPRSLRDLLHNLSKPSLNERIKLAGSLARSVMFVHNLNLVHKNIRPETILTFQVDCDADHHRTTALVGFESFRYADGPTHLSQKQQWERDLYRHPSRQGIRPLVRYAMQHDIYSLGVCLLEIGLWKSLVDYSTNDTGVQYVPGPVLAGVDFVEQRNLTRNAYKVKDFLVQLARAALPAKMGARYTLIVETCLSSWEDDGKDTLFGAKKEFADQKGVLEGVRYSDKILLELENIVV